MNMSKISDKLEDFFDLSKKKREKKHKKIEKIVKKLEEKTENLKEDVREAGKRDRDSGKYRELNRELKVASRLLEKAKKHASKD